MGEQLTERIYLSSPDVTQAEEDALVRALRSGWVAPLGPEVDAFEAELAAGDRRSLRGRAVLGHRGPPPRRCSSSASAPGDVVITSSMTFAATANAITYTGATPVFVDSDETGNLDPRCWSRGRRGPASGPGRDVAAVVPVDLLGKVADHAAIGCRRPHVTASRCSSTPPSRWALAATADRRGPTASPPSCRSTATRS